MTSPGNFVDIYTGKAIAYDGPKYGVQCVGGFKVFCDYVSIPVKACPNDWAESYWTCKNKAGNVVQDVKDWRQKYFELVTDYRQFRNGDWVIWLRGSQSHPLSHVAMYYNGQQFGQRQNGADRSFCLKPTNFADAAGALRPRCWAKGEDMNQGKHKGCDVSEWQNPENTDISEYEYVIIRASYTTSEDKYCDAWVQKCEAENKPYGFYCYSYATSVDWAIEEARKFVEIISRYHPTMGLWLDMEDADHYKQEKWEGYLDPDIITKMSEAWLERVAQEGYYTGIYASESWFGSLIKDTPIMQKYDKWVASWGTNDGNINRDTSYMGTMLQYTSAGGLDKDITYIDLDIYDVKKDKEPAMDKDERIKSLEAEVEKLRKENEKLLGILKKIAALLGL